MTSVRRRHRCDLEWHVGRSRSGRCFVCQFVRGDSDYEHDPVYADDFVVAFLAQWVSPAGRISTQAIGHTLVAPREHREHAAADFTEEEYLALQRVVRRVALALQAELPTERIYVLSLGSKDGNSHVHWHVVPLPPGVPYREQQFEFLRAENGVYPVTREEMAELARRLRARLEAGSN